MNKAATMEDVAREAGCHTSTVSLALRGDSRIPAETRERVRRAAEKLHYRTNPLIAAWVSARRAGRPITRRFPLAYITCHAGDFAWKADVHFRSIFEGARDQAERYGFGLTDFRLSDYARDNRRLNQVLATRSVQGIIIGPALEHHTLTGLEWANYALVTIGYGLELPAVHRVTEDHYLGMKLAFELCLTRGYRRIGLAVVRKHNAVRRERWIGAYLYEQHQQPPRSARLPIFSPEPGATTQRAATWLDKHKPDVVLADDPAAWRQFDVPTLGFALSAAHQFAGVQENNREIGRRAADMLVSLILRNERGLPSSRQTVLVEPTLGNVSGPFAPRTS